MEEESTTPTNSASNNNKANPDHNSHRTTVKPNPNTKTRNHRTTTNKVSGWNPKSDYKLGVLKKHFTVTINWFSSAKILLASTLAALTAYLTTTQLKQSYWTELIIGAAIFLTVYIITASLIGAINRTDIQNLREILKELAHSPAYSTSH